MLITPEMVRAARERLSVPVVLIEEDDVESIILDYTVSQLQRVLAELEAMAPLPRAASEEAVANHDAWMAQSERMSQLKREAEIMALITVPGSVQTVLDAISARELALHGFVIRENDESDEDRLERQAQAHLETAALHRDDPLF